MDRNKQVYGLASDAIEAIDSTLLDIGAVRTGLDDAEKYLKLRKEELNSVMRQCREEVPPPETPPAPQAPKVADDVDLSDVGLPERAWKRLGELGVTKLSELARCRKGDIAGLKSLSKASLSAIYRLLEEKGIVLRDGRSFIDSLKLLQEAALLVPSGDLEEYGPIIGYIGGSRVRGEPKFKDISKLYFQTYDKVAEFLKAAGLRDPDGKLKKLGIDSY